MQISNGVAEISFQRNGINRVNTDKIYLWPRYSAGKVEKVKGILGKSEYEIPYTKASEKEKNEIINMAKELKQNEYSQKGSIIERNRTFQPGILFDAIV